MFIRNFIRFQNNKSFINNIQSKGIFNIFPKNKHLIPHPEFGGENTGIKFKVLNSSNSTIESNLSSPLNFVSLNRNGIPIIKKTYYDSLGVKSTASPQEIRSNFLKIARIYHPDKNPQAMVIFF